MKGLITRELHDRPPLGRYEIDRTEPVPVKPVKMVMIMHKPSRRTYNAILRGQLAEGRCNYKHGPYLRIWNMPINWKPSLKFGREKKAIEITQRKITYAPSEN